jgi:hypothetical protein
MSFVLIMRDLNERDCIIQYGIQTSDQCLDPYNVLSAAPPKTDSGLVGIAVRPCSWQR